ncbi:class I SAM-dependent methyltransferase [Sandarakinorhabdus sp. DWP1-3-1]|uniref:class I SAM-dependent methyltransferase n=1 Tax=Sandarakinorhabdus sp. DWP1-3-1 TaxID=2804627 RepID=UPI003CF40BD6
MIAAVTRARPRLLFARHFFANPRGIGSMIPSSRRLTQRLLAGFDWSTARVIVEYGPGTGVVTRAILAQMAPDARLFAFEINEDFVTFLRRAIPDPRLTVVHDSAESVASALAAAGIEHCDAAISSLPFSIMPPRVRLRILAATARVLAPGAAMVGYQYSTRWLRELRRSFGDVAVDFEPRNWPPAFVFTARRGSPDA